MGYETGKTLQARKDELTDKLQCKESVQNELKAYLNDTDIRNVNESSRTSVARFLRLTLKELSVKHSGDERDPKEKIICKRKTN